MYDAVLFGDLHAEPVWVYEQADFSTRLCARARMSLYKLAANLHGDFLQSFGRRHIASIPFWMLGEDGKKGLTFYAIFYERTSFSYFSLAKRAAPRAPVSWGSGGISRGSFSSRLREATMP